MPRVWQGISYRPLSDTALARPLFEFAALPWPEGLPLTLGWGAWAPAEGDERLVATVIAEAADDAVLLHGPLVIAEAAPLEIATQLVAAVLDHATALGVATVFTRPHSLDRVWVRFGFVPVPESQLPSLLTGRPGSGLYAWRGGSAFATPREALSV